MASDVWFRLRSYAHFDYPLNKKEAIKLATNPERVVQHPFMPVIADYVKSVSRKEDSRGRRTYNKKRRPIAYASHKDSHIYSFYAHTLNLSLEKYYRVDPLCSEAVLAYRKSLPNQPRTNIHSAAEVFKKIKNYGDNCVVVALDIAGFFDNLSHDLLKQSWERFLNVSRLPDDYFAVYKAVTRSSAVFRPLLRELLRKAEVRRRLGRKKRVKICSSETFRKEIVPKLEPFQNIIAQIKKEKGSPDLTKGIPQGLPISAAFANLYMLETDKFLAEKLHAVGGVYRRYSDDILLLLPVDQAKKIEEEVVASIKSIKLNIQVKKTQRILFKRLPSKLVAFSLDENYKNNGKLTHIEYLGFSFDGEKVLMKNATVTKFFIRANKAIRQAKKSAIAEGKRLNKPPKLKKRKLLARLTALGYGQAYGVQVYKRECLLGDHIPRLGFFAYAKRAKKIIGCHSLEKQIRQIENKIYQLINKAEKDLHSHSL